MCDCVDVSFAHGFRMEHRTIIQRKLSRSDRGKAPQNAGQWAKCVTRAAHAALALSLTAGRRHALRVLSDDVPALLTDMGLVAWCACENDVGVFIAFDQNALGAMVEVQTIGRVLGRGCHGRRATQTDFALAIPFIDAILDDAVANDLAQAGFGRKTWVQNNLDISQFSEREFDIVSMSFRMGDGGVSGKVVIGLQIPQTPQLRSNAPEIAQDCPQISELQVQMSAELARIQITLADLAQIKAGHQMILPINVLGDVHLKPQGGGPEYLCSLGRQMGSRAVQMFLDTAAGPVLDTVHDNDIPVPDAVKGDEITSQAPDDHDIEDALDQDWLDALSEYDDAADHDVINGAA